MKIHEYQAKAILARYGVPVPRGEVAFNPDEAGAIAKRLGGDIAVVKAQIHAGGRGKGGGVKLAKSPEEAEQLARHMIGMTLVTHQTGPEGQIVRRLYIEQGLDIGRELYLALVLDRDARRVAIMASTEGGMDIEQVAHDAPEKIHRAHVDPVVGLAAYVGSLSIGGTLRGLSWIAGAPFIESVTLMVPYWLGRAVGGTLMFLSHLVFAWNLWRMRPVRAVRVAVRVPPSSNARSPTIAPGPISATSSPSIFTASTPSRTR